MHALEGSRWTLIHTALHNTLFVLKARRNKIFIWYSPFTILWENNDIYSFRSTHFISYVDLLLSIVVNSYYNFEKTYEGRMGSRQYWLSNICYEIETCSNVIVFLRRTLFSIQFRCSEKDDRSSNNTSLAFKIQQTQFLLV